MRKIKTVLLAVATILVSSSCLSAWDIKILNPQTPRDGYNVFDSSNFSIFRDYLTGTNANLSTGNLNSYDFQSDAVIINLIGSKSAYGSDEYNMISSLLNSSKKVLIFAENDSWDSSNQQLADILGVNYVSKEGAFDQKGYPNAYPEIMTGVDDLYFSSPGVMTPGNGKGISLSDGNAISLWGDNDNFLLLMDVTVLGDRDIGLADNDQLTQNIAWWLAGGKPDVPEPSSYAFIAGVSILGFASLRRRKR